MAVITYNGNIPQPNDDPSQSQPLILANFSGIFDLIDINHEPFDSANAGNHTILTMTLQVATPVGLPANFINIYNKVPAGGNDKVTLATSEMFIQRSVAGDRFPFTASSTGYTYLPSGQLIKYGTATVNGFDQTVTFPTGVDIPPFIVAPYQIFLTVKSSADNAAGVDQGVSLGSSAFTDLIFKVNAFTLSTRAAASVTFRWIAIGLGV